MGVNSRFAIPPLSVGYPVRYNILRPSPADVIIITSQSIFFAELENEMTHGILEEMTRSDFADFRPDTAVLAVGATEPHGMHLPYGTDFIKVDRIVKRAVLAANEQGARALLLPTIPYGIDTNMMEFPHTITVMPTTLIRLIGELADSVAHHGIKKMLLVNGHGGNVSTLETACREFAQRDFFMATINYWMIASDVVKEVIETRTEHACEYETSVALAVIPEYVKMSDAVSGPTRQCRLKNLIEYGGKFTRPWHKFTVNSGVGEPEKGPREKGERIVEAIHQRLTAVIAELSAAGYDEKFPY